MVHCQYCLRGKIVHCVLLMGEVVHCAYCLWGKWFTVRTAYGRSGSLCVLLMGGSGSLCVLLIG